MQKAGKKVMDSDFGAHLRRLRLSKHMSLGDLAAIVDTSRSFLSQIEQGKTLPSLGTLKLIAAALGVTVGALVDEPLAVAKDPIVRKGERPSIERLQAGIVLESLTHRDIHKAMQPLMLRLEPGASSGHETYVHHGQEFAYITKGVLHIEIDGTPYELSEGDSIYFDSTRPHRFHNPNDTEAVAIWVVTPPTF